MKKCVIRRKVPQEKNGEFYMQVWER